MSIGNYFRDLVYGASATSKALSALERSKVELLESEAARDYAEAMAAYNKKQIARLRAFVEQEMRNEPTRSDDYIPTVFRSGRRADSFFE